MATSPESAFSRSSMLELLDLGQSLVLDLDGRILHWTRGCRDLYGYSSEEAIGQISHVLLRTRFPQPLEQIMETLQRSGRWQGELQQRHRDGRELTVATLWAMHRSDAGAPSAILQSSTDITELKRAEAALKESEERFRGTFESAAVGITHIDPQGRWIRVNRKLCETLGYTEAELVGRRYVDLTHPEDREEDLRQYERLMQGELDSYSIEKRYFHKDGAPVWVRVTRSAQRDPAGKARYSICISVIEDIAARKVAEEALVASQRRLFAIIDSAMDAIVTVDSARRIVLFNPAAERMFGARASEVVGHSVDRFIPECFHGAHHGHVEQFAQGGQTARGMGHLGKLVGRRADGSEFPIEASISRVVAGGEQLLSVIVRDITERRSAEEQLQGAKEAAETASRAKDQFLALLSHELRNPLTPVLVTASLLQEDTRFDAETQELFGIIRRNAELESLLINDLLDVTRITRGKVALEKRPVDLCVVAKRAVEVCKRDIEAKKMAFHLDAPEGRCIILADATRMQQVLWNLLQNAVKFTPAGGRVSLRCRCEAGDQVVAEVSDSGMGIEPHMLSRIFDAFDQGEHGTTRQFGGLGLGLTISRALVSAHGGTLEAASKGKGQGATFTVHMPLAVGQEVRRSAGEQSGETGMKRDHPSLRILLVEDHEDTARVLRRLLVTQGHQVEHAGDVQTALQEAADPARFDLLLSDLGLPDGSGLDLMRTLRAHGAKLPSIALSGYGQEQDVRQAREAGFTSHLTKPVTLPLLLDAIAMVTSAPAGMA